MNDDEDVGSVITFADDISDAEAPLPLPEGVYAAIITDVKRVTRKTSGKTGLNVFFKVAPEDFPPDYPVTEAPDGAILVWNRLNIEDTKQGRFNLRRFTGNIGAPPLQRTLDATVWEAWKGLHAKIVVRHDPYEGNIRAGIERIVAAA